MKIALAQLNYHIGNLEANTQRIIEAIDQAKQQGAHLIVFAELALCGYPPLDLLEVTEFINQCEYKIKQIANFCDRIACIIGAPAKNLNLTGKDLYNAAYFIEKGEVKTIVHKALLPNYDVFDEYRYFEPASKLSCIDFMGVKIALTICEDLWNINNNPLYSEAPMDILIKEQPQLMINIAASPFSYTHHRERTLALKNNCLSYSLPLLYVNQVGAQTELIFDGRSLALDAQGQVLDEMSSFAEDIHFYEFDGQLQNLSPLQHHSVKDIALIHDALILGIRDYFTKSGFSKAILGLSGGVDSALVCALASEALGAENLMATLLPSTFSSEHSLKDALDLVKNLGCKHQIISIKESMEAFDRMLQPLFKDLPFNITEENIQSRCRAATLMAISNKFGYVLLNTSNKSEIAVGYGTLYGDLIGALSIIGDLYKTQVYELCQYVNRNKEIIPNNTLLKPPSAELRPDQKDSDSLPEYDVLDKILFEYIELKKSPQEIIALGIEKDLVRRIIALVNSAEFKRHQTPPILRVSPKAFGLGRRLPIVAKYL